MDGYIKKQVSELTGLSPRLVQFYVDQNVVIPELYRGMKRGDHHKYSKRNLFEFALIKELNEWGMNVSIIKSIMKEFTLLFYGAGNYENLKAEKPFDVYLSIYKDTKVPKGREWMFKLYGGGAKKYEKKDPILRVRELDKNPCILTINLGSLFKRINKI